MTLVTILSVAVALCCVWMVRAALQMNKAKREMQALTVKMVEAVMEAEQEKVKAELLRMRLLRKAVGEDKPTSRVDFPLR